LARVVVAHILLGEFDVQIEIACGSLHRKGLLGLIIQKSRISTYGIFELVEQVDRSQHILT
jgi:hypothetical protein